MSEIRTLAVAVLIAGAFSAPLAAQESYLPIVQLEMRGIIIIAHSAPDGPLYTIKNREGEVIEELLDSQMLASLYPEIHKTFLHGIAVPPAARPISGSGDDSVLPTTIED